MKTFKIIFRIIACLIFCTFLFVGYKVLNSVFISHIDTVLDVVNTEEEKYIKYYNEFMNREEISENDYRAFIDGVNNFLIEDYERNKKCSFVSGVILKPIWAFVKTYFIHLGFLDGKLGFEFCLLHSFYTLEKYLKLRALKNNRGRI